LGQVTAFRVVCGSGSASEQPGCSPGLGARERVRMAGGILSNGSDDAGGHLVVRA